MMGHKICFSEEICIIIPKLSLLLFFIWSPRYVSESPKLHRALTILSAVGFKGSKVLPFEIGGKHETS